MQLSTLEHLPTYLKHEYDIAVSPEGEFTVPRIVPLPSPDANASTGAVSTSSEYPLPPRNHILVRVHSSSGGTISGILASVLDANDTGLRSGALVAGLTMSQLNSQYLQIDAGAVCAISSRLNEHELPASDCVLGFAVAVLAPGLSTFTRTSRLNSLRILITHSDTEVGRCISAVYTRSNTAFTQISERSTVLDISRLGTERFDLIISGYEDQPHIDMLSHLLVDNQGRLFMWNVQNAGLASILKEEPCSVGDALQSVASALEDTIDGLYTRSLCETPRKPAIADSDKSSAPPRSRPPFDANRTYLLLGGIGTIGAHIALYMYERGARYITITSRSGEEALINNLKPTEVLHMFKYLQGLKDLHIRLVSANATSLYDMTQLVDNLPSPLGGCMILTVDLSDGLFANVSEEQHSRCFASKTGVLDTLKQVTEISTLEFLVAFSSVSGLFGNVGQTVYAAANTALEEEMASIRNGFSFVCPGIIDSSMMLSGLGQADSRVIRARLGHLIEWSMSAEDMIMWLDDALSRFRDGQRFNRYIPELDWAALDRTFGMSRVGNHLVPERSDPHIALEDSSEKVADIVRDVLNISAEDLSADVPLADYGMDSLAAGRLSSMLRPFIEVSQIQLLGRLSLQDIYRKITRLSSHDATQQSHSSQDATQQNHASRMYDLLEKYTKGLIPPLESHTFSPTQEGAIIIMTGSTGAFGCHILSQLLHNRNIRRVYALNRKPREGASILDKQWAAFVKQGLETTHLKSSKLELVEADLADVDLGISGQRMDELLSSVTHIIHNAWTVDFYMPLVEFEPLIQGTLRLLNFAAQSRLSTPPSFSFISTVGVYYNSSDLPTLPEAAIEDANVSAVTGYLESKWVAERLVQLASQRVSLKTSVIRVGLLTGSDNGCWDVSHWVPALVQSGLYLGCLPGSDELVSWIPVTLAAAAVVELRDLHNETVHIVHPRPVSWAAIMGPIASRLGVPLVEYSEWFTRLERTAQNITSTSAPDAASKNAAVRLIDFFRRGLEPASQRLNTESMGLMPRVEVEKGAHASSTLANRGLPQLGAGDAERWLEFWRKDGFLTS